MAYLKEFQKRLQRNDWPSCLSLWQEYLFSDEIDSEEFIAIVHSFKNSPLAKEFGKVVEEALPLIEQVEGEDKQFRLFQAIVDVETAERAELAERAFQELQKRFASTAHFNEKIRIIGLKSGKEFQGAISAFLLLTHLKKGAAVMHTADWGPALVIDVSFVREEVSLHCLRGGRQRDLSFANAIKTLQPLPAEHFYARLLTDPDDLETFAIKESQAFMHLVLQDLGPLTAGQLKDLLVDGVIAEESWTKWWQQTRTKLKKDTRIHQPESLKEPFYLLQNEIDPWERFVEKGERFKEFEEWASHVYSFWKEHPEFNAQLQQWLQQKGLWSGYELATLLLLEECAAEHTFKEQLAEKIVALDSLPKLYENLSLPALKKRLILLSMELSSWPELCLEYLQLPAPPALRDLLLRQALQLNRLEAFLRKRLERPALQLDFLVYYFQKALQGKEEWPFSDDQGLIQLFEAILIGLSEIEGKESGKELAKRIHAILTQNRFALIRQLLQKSSREFVKEYLLLTSKSQILQQDYQILCSLAYVVFPDLAKAKGHKEEQPLWTTQEGYDRMQAHLRQLATVETVENAREIERARALGDLRENAEYKFALEKRSRLQSEIKTLSTQLHKARILTSEDISTEEIGVGTDVTLLGEGEQRVHYTFLGPWDADPEKNILSFQSKVARDLEGKRVGESIVLFDQRLVIEKIENVLKS